MWKAPSSSPDASLRAPLIPLNTYNVGEKEKQESHWLNPLTYDWRFIADDQIDKYGFVPALEGLRGVVIIPPILSHICDSFPSNEGLGFVGVSSFFVLSGFLVSGVLKRGYESVARASGGQRPSLFVSRPSSSSALLSTVSDIFVLSDFSLWTPTTLLHGPVCPTCAAAAILRAVHLPFQAVSGSGSSKRLL